MEENGSSDEVVLCREETAMEIEEDVAELKKMENVIFGNSD